MSELHRPKWPAPVPAWSGAASDQSNYTSCPTARYALIHSSSRMRATLSIGSAKPAYHTLIQFAPLRKVCTGLSAPPEGDLKWARASGLEEAGASVPCSHVNRSLSAWLLLLIPSQCNPVEEFCAYECCRRDDGAPTSWGPKLGPRGQA